MQASSDIFLGGSGPMAAWTARGDFYVRQLRDWENSIAIEP